MHLRSRRDLSCETKYSVGGVYEKILSFYETSVFHRNSVSHGVGHSFDNTACLGIDGVSGVQSDRGSFWRRTADGLFFDRDIHMAEGGAVGPFQYMGG